MEICDPFRGFNFFVPSLVAHILISIFVPLGMLLCVIPRIVLAAMYMITFLFIPDKKMDFWPAMEPSAVIVKKDYIGVSLFIVALGLLQVLGALACIIGIFVTLPIMYLAIMLAYRDLVGFEPSTQNR